MVALVAALLTFTGCDDGTCEDADGDGFGIGGSCEAPDCNDSDPLHHSDCLSCSDPDNDGRGVGCDLGPDCAPSNDRHWADCGNCTDLDRDGYGVGCDRGEDCSDDDPDQFTACSACVDADGDGSFAGCEAFVNRPGPDCNDSDPDNYLRCDYCADVDGDGRFANCDRYSARMGPDCNDTDANNWDSCGTCRDMDADTYSTGCDAYAGDLKGPDCNDANALHWSDCGTCTDNDGDGRGSGTCDLGNDPCDDNRDAWMSASCAACIDADTDGRYAGCDAYFVHAGPDCNDADGNSWSSCATCVDLDTDGRYTGCDTYTTAKPFDCNDLNANAYTASGCANCRDNDADMYYVGCDVYATVSGPDCGDGDANNWTQCSTCADTDGDGRYAQCDSYGTIAGPDCDPASNQHWSDCSTCVDNDGDGRGTACDLGADCNDSGAAHWDDCSTCTDIDGDGYGIGTCNLAGTDCSDMNPLVNPGASDTTVNGIDEDCNGIDGPGFADNFDDGAYTPQWTTVSGDTTLQTTYSRSASYALNLGGSTGSVASLVFDMSACGASGLVWSYWGKRGPEPPDSGENLLLEYWNGTAWTLTDTFLGASVTDSTFSQRTGVITNADARHAGFRIRFRTTGGGTGIDDYFVDDVSVGCATDTDGDGVTDTLDCAPSDPDHWSDCSTCVDTDMDDYGTGCDRGTDCNEGDPAINPAASDPTVDGTDQNCNGIDGPGFYDGFEDGTYTPQWTSNTGDTAIQTTYRHAGTYGMNLGGGSATVTSTFFDTSACTAVAWRYFGKRGPVAPDSSDTLSVQYWNGTGWTTFDTWPGNGSDDAAFAARTGIITAAAALRIDFRIRFLSSGDGTGTDDFYIDEVAADCGTDGDGDGVANAYDCASTDPDHWADCGVCVDGDADDYGAGCDLGADCADADPAINPGEPDPTTDGTDQNCDGYDGIPPNPTSCAAIKSTDPTATSGTYTIYTPTRTVYCDMRTTGVTYEELGFGPHNLAFAGYTQVTVADLQDSVLQQAFIELYNLQGGGAVNISVGFSSGNCCFRAGDSATGQMLFLGGSYLYPYSTSNAEQCNGTYTASHYRFRRISAAETAPNPMPTNYFATRAATNQTQCSTDRNPAFFWKRF